MNEPFSILVIDDEPVIRDSCLQILSRKGCKVWLSENGRKGLDCLNEQKIDIVILDLKLPDVDGLDVLCAIRESGSETVVIVITAYPTVECAVTVMKAGAFDYIPKPFTPNVLRTTVARALERRKREHGRISSYREFKPLQGADAIIGKSPVIMELKKFIVKAGMSDCSVLVSGETGTGKELVARALHYCSRRRHNNFITVDSGGLADTLIESELFGHVRGSFSGAYTDRVGRFEMAHRGTIFFDEISNMSNHVQGKLLRVIQEQEFARVGSSQNIDVNVRIIAATNRILLDEIKNGAFREDLYYRLNVISIHMPPLRERRLDIPVLAEYFLNLYRQKKETFMPERISDKSMRAMINYDWPGNVRELENVMERAVALCDEKEVDPFSVLGNTTNNNHGISVRGPMLKQLEDVEKEYIEKALKECQYNKSRTATALGIDRKTLRKKIQKYGIDDSDD